MLVTVFSATDSNAAALGKRWLLTAENRWLTTATAGSTPPPQLPTDALAVLANGHSLTCDYATAAGPARAFLEVLRPALRLTVFGAGDDAQPLVRLAASLGWRVQVIHSRPAQAQAGHFPEAEAVRVLPVAELPSLPSDDAYAVLLSHNYAYDLAALQYLQGTATPYIGLLGPRTKARRMLEDLAEWLPEATARLRDRLYSPVGLDLGAETPEEVALSIVAEIQAVASGHPAGFLRDSTGAIHERPAAEPPAALVGATRIKPAE
ncbi:XdhC family protein [Hymenobacter sp. B81]|uniref:XdhC family protein n=1 Tax=Hymenobacter sp. B81 TaxID=3344878 RepID=UPI0037DD8436